MQVSDHQERVINSVSELARELNPEYSAQVTPSTHLEWDLGLGSIERHELLVRLEKSLEGSLSSEKVFQASTVADLLELIPGAQTSDSKARVELHSDGVVPHPEHAQDLIEALLYQAQHRPHRDSLIFLEDGEEVTKWSYPDLVAAAQKVAAGLAKRGVQRGDRVAIMLPTGCDYVASFYGVLWLGAIPVPIYPPFRLDQIEDYIIRQSAILRISGARHLISFDRAKAIVPLFRLHCPELKSVATVKDLEGKVSPPNPFENALIQFTSGSTGTPKGVVLTHQALMHNIRGYQPGFGLIDQEIVITWLPLYHDMGLIGNLLASVYHGKVLILMGPQDFLARPSRWLWAIHRYGGTISGAPNFAYEICATKLKDEELDGLDLSSWRVAVNGAEAIRPETLRKFSKRFAPYGFKETTHFPGYGLAEATLAVTFSPPGRGFLVETVDREILESEGVAGSCRPGKEALELVACGRPLPEMEVRIVGDDGTVLEEKHRGHIQFRGPSSLSCYFENPEATAATKDADGWVKTGDLGFLSEGELYLTGRSKDIIIKAGRNIQAEDVETIVAEVDGVRRGCVAAFAVTTEDQASEQLVVVAETRIKDKPGREELRVRIEREISQALGLPADRVVVASPNAVPKTPSGKIRRSACKERFLNDRLEPSSRFVQARDLLSSGIKRSARRLLSLPREWGRRAWCLTWLGGLLSLPQVIAQVSPAKARRSLHACAKIYLKAVGVRLDIRGPVGHPEPCILVCNHCSTLDPVILSAVWPTPLSFMVAPWVADHFALRGIMSKLGHVAVHRGDPSQALEQQEILLDKLRRGESLAIFPEGGIETTPGLRPFAVGAFRLAALAGVPVIPVALQGTRAAQTYPSVVPLAKPVQAAVGPTMMAEDEEWKSIVTLSREAREWVGEYCGDPVSQRRMRRHD